MISKKYISIFRHIFFLQLIIAGCSGKIDLFALVSRHNVNLIKPDTLDSLNVGNGEFAYTGDITGMQTFYEEYENGISLGTQSQWGWHTTPTHSNYTINDVSVSYESCNGKNVPFAIQHKEGKAFRAGSWLRANPHRLHLGIIGLSIFKKNGEEINLSDVQNPKQQFDLWTGNLRSEFEIEGESVKIETVSHQDNDLLVLSHLLVKTSFVIYSNHICLKVNVFRRLLFCRQFTIS